MRPSCQSTRENKKKDNKTKTSSLLLLLLWINGCCYLFPPPPSASVSLLSVCLISPLWSCRAQLCPLQVEITRRRGRRPQIWARRGEGMFLWWINVFIYGTCWGKRKKQTKIGCCWNKNTQDVFYWFWLCWSDTEQLRLFFPTQQSLSFSFFFSCSNKHRDLVIERLNTLLPLVLVVALLLLLVGDSAAADKWRKVSLVSFTLSSLKCRNSIKQKLQNQKKSLLSAER